MGNSGNKDTSASRPFYPTKTGYTPDTEPRSPEQQQLYEKDKQNAVDNQNNEYRNDNPLLAIADDGVTFVKKIIYVTIGLSGAYLLLEGYKVYKE